jgi:hypothetical protein
MKIQQYAFDLTLYNYTTKNKQLIRTEMVICNSISVKLWIKFFFTIREAKLLHAFKHCLKLKKRKIKINNAKATFTGRGPQHTRVGHPVGTSSNFMSQNI